MDESHPHMHFFVVGDANKLHPGLKNEFEDGKRIKDSSERFLRHKIGLRNWLKDYSEEVSEHCGLQYIESEEPVQRVENRAIHKRLVTIEKALAEHPNNEIQQLLDELLDSLQPLTAGSPF